jgi:RNA polymerase sigma-70 factor (ECF subfamily)
LQQRDFTVVTATTSLADNRSVATLVRAAQAGSRTAFGELFVRFERQVFAIALRRVRNFTEAQELTQDVFVQALRKISQLRTPECFGAWLRSITRRMAVNRLARRRYLCADDEALDSANVEERTPLATVLDTERDEQLHAGLDRLRDLDRETLVAFYVDGRSLAEMSDEFAAPLGTIKRRLHVARKRLAKEMESLVAV